jgi:hypothetical protein
MFVADLGDAGSASGLDVKTPLIILSIPKIRPDEDYYLTHLAIPTIHILDIRLAVCR